jgi:hypothetical protein
MAQLGEAVARFNNLFESPAYRDLEWANALQQKMRTERLMESGRLVAPILRPHFLSKRQHASLARAVQGLSSVLDRLEPIVLSSPPLMSRLQMLPAEKLLATLPAGYSRFSVTPLMDVQINNGSLHFGGVQAYTPPGVAYADRLANLFLELPITQEFRRNRYKLSKLSESSHLLAAVLKVWKEFGGRKTPNIAVVEIKQQFSSDSNESFHIAELLKKGGETVRVLCPEQLQYSNGKLQAGDFSIDLVFRRVSAQELLVRHDLSHPLLQAYRDRAVCVVNSFRSELAQRRALFELLTDEDVTSKLPASDRELIREFVPWTRVVSHTKTQFEGQCIDLPNYILKNRERFVLRPNDKTAEQRCFIGRATDEPSWDRAVRSALRSPYVVQEYVPSVHETFPVYQYGELHMRPMEISVHPHTFAGKMQGASAVLQTASNGFSSPVAIAPVFLIEEA